VEEGLLGVHDEGVRDPEQLHEPAVQAQALVALEHQALVRPALAEEYGGGVVLRGDRGYSEVTAEQMDDFKDDEHFSCTILTVLRRFSLQIHISIVKWLPCFVVI